MPEEDYTNLFIIIIIGFSILFISMFVYILRQDRKPKKMTNDFYLPNIKDFEIDLRPELTKILNTNLTLMKYLPSIFVFLMYICVMGMVVLGDGPEGFQALLQPSSTLFQISIIVFFLMAMAALVVTLATKEERDILGKALLLAKDKPLKFKLNQEQITMPVIALGDTAFRNATQKNLYEVSIPFHEIISFEVWPWTGNRAHAQYSIKPTGDSQYLGEAVLGLKEPRIGIRREYLTKHEQKILSFLKDRLGEKLIIIDKLETPNQLNKIE